MTARRAWWWACVIAFASLASPARAEERDWEKLLEEDGITVYARDNGTSLPTFRGEGIVDSNILQILAVFQDDARHEEWMYSCRESTIIDRFSDVEALVYSRTAAPWPVSDRDVVIHAKLTYDVDTLEAWNRFERVETTLRPEADGVVRMSHLRGFYHLVVIDAERTAVVYQVDSDPGGLLPDWITRIATRRLPLHTLRGLRRQAKKTRGDYEDLIAGWIEKYKLPVSGVHAAGSTKRAPKTPRATATPVPTPIAAPP